MIIKKIEILFLIPNAIFVLSEFTVELFRSVQRSFISFL